MKQWVNQNTCPLPHQVHTLKAQSITIPNVDLPSFLAKVRLCGIFVSVGKSWDGSIFWGFRGFIIAYATAFVKIKIFYVFLLRLGDLIPGSATKRIGPKTFEYIWFHFWFA